MTKDLDQKVAHAMGLKSVNNCEQWGASMNEKEINKAFDEEYIKYREAFPKDYDIPALTQTDYERGFIDGMQKQMQSSVDKAVNHMAQTEQEPPKYSFKAHWEKDGRIGVVAAIVRSDGGVHILEDIIDAPQRTERPVDCERCNRLEEQAYDLVGKLRVANIKLSMQPQRTWIGLTIEDVKVIEDNAPSKQMAIFMADATLKEKNT